MPTDSVSRSAQDYSFNFHQTMKNGCSAAARLRQNVTDNVGGKRKLPGSGCDLVPARDCQTCQPDVYFSYKGPSATDRSAESGDYEVISKLVPTEEPELGKSTQGDLGGTSDTDVLVPMATKYVLKIKRHSKPQPCEEETFVSKGCVKLAIAVGDKYSRVHVGLVATKLSWVIITGKL
ncbi:hypothetical protein Bbelb_333930 [Branchiostoma belcheri]|nr:hypothetical protein Bbelb_333930 [Branchiostoma belcheri]